jgi:hypothetical protein
MAKKIEAAKNVAMSEMGAARPGTLELVFERDIKIESIHKGVEAAFRWHGCTPCGMNGFDLRLRAQNPAFDAFKEVEGLRDINVYR